MNNDTKTPREWEGEFDEIAKYHIGLGSTSKLVREFIEKVEDNAESRTRAEAQVAIDYRLRMIKAQLESIADETNTTQMVIDLRNFISNLKAK